MSMETNPRTPIAAVGIVCLRGRDVLLVRRSKPPRKDGWSLPGGRIEWGETAEAAALRELKEETGCDATLVGLIDVVNAIAPDPAAAAPPWGHYVLIDYAARWTGGDPIAGDDASEARFFAPEEIPALNLWSETLRIVELARAMVG
jgi:8-oxo-dGTP diphosphatase